MKLLPIGKTEFSKIIEGGFVYVDKTEQIYHAIRGAEYLFLARPRRFGKSLLCSTLREMFSGRRNLFQGLWINQSDFAWQNIQCCIFPSKALLTKLLKL